MATILIVDDEPALLELLKRLLQVHGYSVVTALNGEEALLKMAEVRPNLVISDVTMPKMNGYLLLHEIKNQPEWQGVRVVLISGGTIEQPSNVKADAYLSKPYNYEVVSSVVAQLCATF